MAPICFWIFDFLKLICKKTPSKYLWIYLKNFSYTLSFVCNSPVKIAKIEKKNRVVLKIGRIVEGNFLNNILKVPAGKR